MYKIVPPKILSIAFPFQMWRTDVRISETTAEITDGSSMKGAELLKIRSVVRSLKQIAKSTAIESAGINFSINKKNFGVFRFAKITNGRKRSANIIIPIARVAIKASVSVSFIFSPPEQNHYGDSEAQSRENQMLARKNRISVNFDV